MAPKRQIPSKKAKNEKKSTSKIAESNLSIVERIRIGDQIATQSNQVLPSSVILAVLARRAKLVLEGNQSGRLSPLWRNRVNVEALMVSNRFENTAKKMTERKKRGNNMKGSSSDSDGDDDDDDSNSDTSESSSEEEDDDSEDDVPVKRKNAKRKPASKKEKIQKKTASKSQENGSLHLQQDDGANKNDGDDEDEIPFANMIMMMTATKPKAKTEKKTKSEKPNKTFANGDEDSALQTMSLCQQEHENMDFKNNNDVDQDDAISLPKSSQDDGDESETDDDDDLPFSSRFTLLAADAKKTDKKTKNGKSAKRQNVSNASGGNILRCPKCRLILTEWAFCGSTGESHEKLLATILDEKSQNEKAGSNKGDEAVDENNIVGNEDDDLMMQMLL